MDEIRKNMETLITDIYKEHKIYIYFETFGKGGYVLCSYYDNGRRKFKLNKTELIPE